MKNILISFQLLFALSAYSQTGIVNYISTETAAKSYSGLSEEAFYIFPETRENPLKWNDSLQVSWLDNDYSKTNYVLQAQPAEYFVYQVGVWAIKSDLKNIKLSFSDLKATNGKTISSKMISCFNTGGVDYLGNHFTKEVAIQSGKVQSLWIGVDLSEVAKGTYYGTAEVAANNKTQKVKIQLEVDGEEVKDHGFNEGKRLSRMHWLNNTLGINDEVTKGYQAVSRNGNTLHILGRTLDIAANGLPSGIASYFAASNQNITQKAEPIISEALRFVIEKENGDIIALQPGKLQFTAQAPGFIAWEVKSSSSECELVCSGRLEFDGFADYSLTLKALEPLKIKDIRLEVPVDSAKSAYMMGLNHEGGLRPASWQWKWDTTKHQDALWMGAVNGGLRLKLKSDNYTLPLVNIYYKFGPLNLPPSWGNDNKGGVEVREKGDAVWINAYSGSREMEAGKVLNFDFELLITPFRTISNEVKYGDRYFHGGGKDAFSKIEKANKAGANIINIHHAENIYPFINYPYQDENISDLKQLVNDAHADSLRLKLYYTTRELTKNIPEFQAFYSLNGELLFPGPGNESRTEALHPNGPNEWLVKNLRENYVPAWYNPISEGRFKGSVDLSVITTPNSRLNNFYIGGLDWMLKNLKIDGVYIDDAALDRFTMRRARKLIDHYRPEGRMDLHSWNHFNDWAGYASCLNLYMDLLPYFDLVWIGEGRDYNRLPDHWLVEVSGIPFGLPGQMLEGGGNPWRGMVYGITNRAGWAGNTPDELWKFYDQYSFKEKELIGYWDNTCPVATNNENIVASVFKGENESIIALANWSNEDQVSSLIIDWDAIGYDPSRCRISIPYVKDFQDEQPLQSLSAVNVPGKKGYMIVIKEIK
ncbi:MAG: glycoside hydrolase domain-containing protein [Anditalea sp.]